ncbi:hypothetical protein C5167_018501 [Papaver somniferum]|uniref:Uncharacterized protein n=1 Tax=Papaver somniferum TaxID=3469 RepID=A0A4Y7IQS3_PAPSO|nr:hypothetical protein C5167_018501 [Papaver somniferum]
MKRRLNLLILRVHEVLESIQEREKTLAKNEKVFARDTQVLQEVRQELIKQPNHPDEVTFGEELRVGRKAMTKIKVTPAGFPYQYYQGERESYRDGITHCMMQERKPMFVKLVELELLYYKLKNEMKQGHYSSSRWVMTPQPKFETTARGGDSFQGRWIKLFVVYKSARLYGVGSGRGGGYGRYGFCSLSMRIWAFGFGLLV